MPYVINWPPAKRAGARVARLALAGLLVAAAMSVLAGPAMADTTSCSAPTLTQPFLSSGDSNWYTLAPGESANSFDGTGWRLVGDASVVSTQLADGTTGNVLDIPGGSLVVSPPMCVDLTYQTARAMVRNLSGRDEVLFAVMHQDPATGNWGRPHFGGLIGGDPQSWTLSPTVNLQPRDATGWQEVRFAFISLVPGSDAQLYDFYVDPYAKG